VISFTGQANRWGPNAISKLDPTPLFPSTQLSLVAHRPHGRPHAIDPLEHTRRPLIEPQHVRSNKLIRI
jgi:hypothetical protein